MGLLRRGWAALLLSALAGAAMAQPEDTLDLSPYLKRDTYETIRISPDGRHFAATLPMEDRTALVVLRREDKRVVTKAIGVEHSAVADFWWVDDAHIVIAMAQAWGSEDALYRTGQLHVVGIDGSPVRQLIGETGQGIVHDEYGGKAGWEYATLIDTLPGDAGNVLVAVWDLASNARTRVEKLDVRDGTRHPVTSAPVQRAWFATDASGTVRFAVGTDVDNYSKLFYRAGARDDWRLVNDQRSGGRVIVPLGFAADGRTAYLQTDQAQGPDVVEAWDMQTLARRRLAGDAVVSPYSILHDSDGRTPIGVRFMSDGTRSEFFDDRSLMARTHRALESAFPDASVTVTSMTRDARLALVQVWSDRLPGEYFLYDMQTHKADGVFAQRQWLDPKTLPATRQITLPARDGVQLHGYLTAPVGDSGGKSPMVVMVHGGPFGIFDEWDFDTDTQILAAAGYAVLRVNYRGSGNYGQAFEKGGAREWGGKMQDDVTDATRWAIDQGIADGARICIFGASYGGYAALMGVAKEPDLYRCAAGYVGVYDLVAMHSKDSRRGRWVGNWADDWVGERSGLAQRSPVQMAERIKVPVFLAAGGKDPRAPIGQTKKMAAALRSANAPVQTLYYENEGHGFTTEAHRREFYAKLVDFLAANIGGKPAR